MFDREKQVISKGVSSVKFLNKKVSRQLYNVYQKHRPNTFMEVLRVVDAETECDDRQLSNLIKIDYFAEYGNCAELLKLYDIYKYFKRGEAKSIKKDKLTNETLAGIVKAYSTDVGVNGNELKSYTITDMNAILRDCEQVIRSYNIPDLDIKVKIANQLELLGYIDIVTGNPRDRKRLIVLEVFPLRGAGGVPWGHGITVRSIGTGNEARLTIREKRFEKKPLVPLNVIWSTDLYKNQKGYWYLDDYEILV